MENVQNYDVISHLLQVNEFWNIPQMKKTRSDRNAVLPKNAENIMDRTND